MNAQDTTSEAATNVGDDGTTAQPGPSVSPVTSTSQILSTNLSSNVAMNLSMVNLQLSLANFKLISELSINAKHTGNSFTDNLELSKELLMTGIKLAGNSSDEAINQQCTEVHSSTADSNTSITIKDYTTFHCFGRLPPEIRIMIWDRASKVTRVVEIHDQDISRIVFTDATRTTFNRVYGREFRVFNNLPPAILQINREARTEGLKHYKLGSINTQQYPTYSNVDSDIIALLFDSVVARDRWANTWTRFLQRNGWAGRSIKKVAISLNHCERYFDETIYHVMTLGVQELVLMDSTHIQSSDLPNWHRNLDLVTLKDGDMFKSTAWNGLTYNPLTDGPVVLEVGKFLADFRKKAEREVEALKLRIQPVTVYNELAAEDYDEDREENSAEAGEQGEGGDTNEEKLAKHEKKVAEFAKKWREMQSPRLITMARVKFRDRDDEVQQAKRNITMI